MLTSDWDMLCEDGWPQRWGEAGGGGHTVAITMVGAVGTPARQQGDGV